MRLRTVLTPIGVSTAPVAGDVMRGPQQHGPAYRIVSVTLLRQAGKPRLDRYRLRCALIAHQPDTTPVHPWRLAPPARPVRHDAMPAPIASPLLASIGVCDLATAERLRFKVPALFAMAVTEPIALSKRERAFAERQRVMQIHRDQGVTNGADAGHSIRQATIKASDGAVLREPDVVIEHAVTDPDAPAQSIRRARRADPMATLLAHGSISKRQFAGIERLRSDLEASVPSLSGATQSEVHAAPWDRIALTDNQMMACERVREVIELVPERARLVLVWMLSGGTVSGFVAHLRRQRQKTLDDLRTALTIVADAYRIDREKL